MNTWCKRVIGKWAVSLIPSLASVYRRLRTSLPQLEVLMVRATCVAYITTGTRLVFLSGGSCGWRVCWSQSQRPIIAPVTLGWCRYDFMSILIGGRRSAVDVRNAKCRISA